MAGINNYHNEALRKARILQRQRDAAKQQLEMTHSRNEGISAQKLETVRKPDSELTAMSGERRSNGIYRVIYPGSDNREYTENSLKKNRRIIANATKYDIRSKVNGEWDVEILRQLNEDN
ncbi:DgyrCDS5691 [Dimorphilus gyrociliatus]|uniref:DgyrCDS5691 n=1 Tax=Dimorphilus gyrociliatus TaxID=2664684 RepID=A0A7I8VMA2_9ANNE|nr:DgyrCDS5691 [Dimorphilus gyrociliatus]